MNKGQVGKMLALLLAVTLALGGCAAKGPAGELDPAKPVTIELWNYYNGPQKLAFDQMVGEFNDTVGMETGIIVEAYSQGGINELNAALQSAINKEVDAQSMPQVFASYADNAYQLDQLGVLAALDGYLTEEELDEYVPAYLEEGRLGTEGNLKIFPIGKSTEVMMVNKTDWDSFAQATGAKQEDLSTWEGVCRVAEAYYQYTDALTPQPNDGKAFFGRDAMANYLLIGSMQLGVEMFAVSGGELKLNLDEQALRRLWDNFYTPYIKGYFLHNGRFRSDDIKTGDIVAMLCSTSASTYFPESVTINDTVAYPIEPMVLPCPSFEGGKRVVVQQGAGMVVAKTEPKLEYAAVQFLKWFTDAQRNISFSISSGYMPVKKAANEPERISQSIQAGGEAYNLPLRLTLPVAAEQVSQDQLYTNRPFKGGVQAREVLEDALIDQAVADRQAVEERLQAGQTLEAATEEFLTDAHFSAWYASLTGAIEAAVA